MDNTLYRKKSLEKISSPEQLQDYMRVTNPGVWMVLAAVIILLAGAFVCACTGRLETTLQVRASAQDGTVTVSLPSTGQDARKEAVQAGMKLRVSGVEEEIQYVYEKEDGVLTCTARMDLPDGTYDAEIVTESVSPISFLIN